jgi:outer membrane protein
MLHTISRTLFTATTVISVIIAGFSSATYANNLTDIYELALINDPTLQAAEASYKAGSEIKAQAISQLLPQLKASASYKDSDEDAESLRFFSANQPFPSNFQNESETKSYNISLTQSLFNLQAFFAFKQSKALSKQAELQFAIDQQSLIIRTAEAYFDVLRSRDNLTSALSEEKAINQQLEQTQQRYDVGLIAITDVHESRAAFDLAVAERLTEEVNLGIAYENLAALTGQQHTNIYNLASDFATAKPQPETAEAWVEFASNNNLSIKLAEQIAEASNQNASVKKSAHAPTIKGSITYQDTSSDTSQFDNDSAAALPDSFSNTDGTTFEVSIDIPIFLGGLTHSERRQAGYERVRDQANLVAAKRTAFREARSSYLITVADTARINARSLAITSAESALDATQAGYDAGTRNIVDLLNAQRDLFRAQRDHANTRYDYVINSLKLKEAAGILSPADIYDINKWLVPPAPVLKSQTMGSDAG